MSTKKIIHLGENTDKPVLTCLCGHQQNSGIYLSLDGYRDGHVPWGHMYTICTDCESLVSPLDTLARVAL